MTFKALKSFLFFFFFSLSLPFQGGERRNFRRRCQVAVFQRQSGFMGKTQSTSTQLASKCLCKRGDFSHFLCVLLRIPAFGAGSEKSSIGGGKKKKNPSSVPERTDTSTHYNAKCGLCLRKANVSHQACELQLAAPSADCCVCQVRLFPTSPRSPAHGLPVASRLHRLHLNKDKDSEAGPGSAGWRPRHLLRASKESTLGEQRCL